jgi:anti-anti-sigma factor
VNPTPFDPSAEQPTGFRDDIVFARPRRGRPPARVAPTLLQHSVDCIDGKAVAVRFHGSLDNNSALAFRDAVFSAMGRSDGVLDCDLGNIVHIDTSGISHLITSARVAALTGVELRFRLSVVLESLFQETGLQRLLHPEPVRGDQIARRILEPPA